MSIPMHTEKRITAEILERSTEKIIENEISGDEEALQTIEEIAFLYQDRLDLADLTRTIDRVFGKLRGQLGPLNYLMDDGEISEIMINGVDRIYVEKKGDLYRIHDSFDTVIELEQVIRRIAASVRREINEMNPILDARLRDGSRVNAILSNVALDGPSLTIRKFSRNKITMDEMVKEGELTDETRNLLEKLVAAGYNIFVSGGTSSGKTTFLNALSEFIPLDERVVTIEDSAELQMNNIPNLVRLECKNANVTGRGSVSMDMLIRTSLRMRPDRIVVGEVRGREVADMLQALNTGHSGMSTGHGNSIKGMLRRLEAMYISGIEMPMDAIRSQVVEGIDIMVQLARLKNGERKVLEISEINGYDGKEYEINTLYSIDDNLNLKPTGNKLINTMKLKLRGIVLD